MRQSRHVLLFQASQATARPWHAEQYSEAGGIEKVSTTVRYAIVIENAGANYSAYVPDLPGCVATGATIDDVEGEIREAIQFHLEGLREDGSPMPPASSAVRYVDIAALT
jgi:predicted RNase H-like HicB family nuclease